MTAEEIKRIDEERRRREDELLLLLLLLLARAVSDSPDDRFDVTPLAVVMRDHGVREIAESMADAHLDASGVGDRNTLVREYDPSARAMADAIVETVIRTGGTTLADALLASHYSRSDSEGLRLGAERQIVSAHNAGLIAGAVTAYDVTALRHVSVIDDATTVICRQRDGLVLYIDDPYWLANWPSLHWRCRSIVEPVRGPYVVSTTYPMRPADDGFGVAPMTVVNALRGRVAA
jgi:SPP1 gp7 family putative phage head morphogenesis protein